MTRILRMPIQRKYKNVRTHWEFNKPHYNSTFHIQFPKKIFLKTSDKYFINVSTTSLMNKNILKPMIIF